MYRDFRRAVLAWSVVVLAACSGPARTTSQGPPGPPDEAVERVPLPPDNADDAESSNALTRLQPSPPLASIPAELAEARAELGSALQSFLHLSATPRRFIHTDKALYQPGEIVWFRLWELGGARADSKSHDGATATVEFLDPRGTVVVSKHIAVKNGALRGDILLAASATGGRYTLRLKTLGQTVDKPITVSSYRTPQIKKHLEFTRASYRGGDRVQLAVALNRSTGEPLGGQRSTAIVSLNGVGHKRLSFTTDRQGRALVQFPLPADVGDGRGLVTVLIDAGGMVESAQKSIPIQRAGIDVQFFPEGGDLIAELPGRVYFIARRRDGRPARLTGRVVDDQGRQIAEVASTHRGMGRFDITPRKGRTYHLEVPEQPGRSGLIPLPGHLDEGCSLRAVDAATRHTSVRVGLWCTEDRQIIVNALMREQRAGDTVVAITGRRPHLIEIPLPEALHHERGIVRITALDHKLVPLAERLVYRDVASAHTKQPGGLRVALRSDRASYLPGDRVELEIETRDSRGRPVPADLSLAVVDDAALALADDRSPNLPSAFLLVSELARSTPERERRMAAILDHIGDPDFYLGAEKKAAVALDLVLGTHGWRRLVWKRVFDKDQDHDRILDMDDQCPTEPETYNGMDDEDGCPDRGRVLVVANKIEIRDPRAKAPPPPPPPPKPKQVLNDPVGQRAGHKRQQTQRAAGWERQATFPYAKVREFPTIPFRADRRGPRQNFRETIFWQASVRTNHEGRASVRFVLSDSVTSFRATAQGVSQPVSLRMNHLVTGQVGHGELLLTAQRPVTASLTLPKEVAAGDRFQVPVTLANNSDESITASIEARFGAGLVAHGKLPRRLQLDPGARRTLYADLTAQNSADRRSSIRVAVQPYGPSSGPNSGLADELLDQVAITPAGYPFQHSEAGTLAVPDGKKSTRSVHSVALGGSLPGSIEATVTAYPSPVATMLRGAEALVREPHGCFEQASSSNYPNVLVLQYLQEHGIADPELTAKTMALLARGYRKLVGYESRERGYEWFGGDPGHEALTAYGLLEFTDMARVFQAVEPKMLARTEKWLLNRRDGKGGFARNQRALDSFGRASPAVTDAYITYAISQSILARTGPTGTTETDSDARKRAARSLRTEISRQREVSRHTADPYLLALATRTLFALQPGTSSSASGSASDGLAAAARLVALQASDGSFPGADHSVTRSGGKNLLVETTALALMAMMDAGNRHEPAIRKAVSWLRDARSGSGSFGATQATVLALQALTMYARHARAQGADGALTVSINGRRIRTVRVPKDSRKPVVLTGLGRHFTAGENRVTLDYRGRGSMPFALAVDYRAKEPAPDPGGPVQLTTSLSRAQVPLGEPVTLRATVENRSNQGLPMVLARVGIPGGLRFQPSQLEALRRSGLVDFIETRPREVMLYWRGMAPASQRVVNIELLSTLPGRFTGPASQAYLYYDDERRQWVPPATVEITRAR